MKHKYLIILALFLYSCTANNETEKTPTKVVEPTSENFDWLLGEWGRTNEKEGRETYEYWTKISDLEYEGVGYTMEGQDTIWQESIQLIKSEEEWNFAAKGMGDTLATFFELTEIGVDKFVCENEENEFPKKIHYFKEKDDLKAVISGGEMEVAFDFKRIKK